MVLGVIYSLLVVSVGYTVLRGLGVRRSAATAGLLPGVGFATLAIVSSWPTLLGGHEKLAAGLVGMLSALAAFVGIAAVGAFIRTLRGAREQRLLFVAIVAACVIPLFVLGGAEFVLLGVPIYAADGAHHVETIDAMRSGAAWSSWYPPGFHASVAALLQLLPWLDSAAGATDASLALAGLAPLGVFGLGCVLLEDRRMAAAGALLSAVTIEYPYLLHYWSIWPMGSAILMTVALWIVGAEYLRAPAARLAILGGVLAAGIVLTHGTEVYTSAIGLLVILAFNWQRVVPLVGVKHLTVAAGLATLFAAPYVPSLFGWAAAGGAIAAGSEWFDHTQQVAAEQGIGSTFQFWVGTISAGLLFDLPFRVALLTAGVWWAVRARRAGIVITLCLVFAALIAVFAAVDSPIVKAVFARTHPWGVPNRLAMIPAIPAALLSGAGLVSLVTAFRGLPRSMPGWFGVGHGVAWRRASRLAGILCATLSVGIVLGLSRLVVREADATTSFSPDDAVALSWLRQNAQPGDVVINDGQVDAGIWMPYKTGVRIVEPRLMSWAPADAEAVLRDNVGKLDQVAAARDAVCALGVHYVYSGVTPHDPPELRHFPSLAVLRASPALEQVFSTPGGAAVFHVRVGCEADRES